MLNETHDPYLRSWVASANDEDSEFPVQNLPFCAWRAVGSDDEFRIGVGIGDQILDMCTASLTGTFDGAAEEAATACIGSSLNDLMQLGGDAWAALRLGLSRALREDSPAESALRPCLVAQSSVEYALPVEIGNFTDFFASEHHARRTGALSRPNNPVLPNYDWVPVAYHSRPSSVQLSGSPLFRPNGQFLPAKDATIPVFGPTRKLDYELELGCYIGTGNALGHPISLDEAERHIFGMSLLNDWSARDIQSWEAQPLGPFLAKNFATTVSPWVVTLEALAPYRTHSHRRDNGPLPHLVSTTNSAHGGIDILLECWVQSSRMQAQGMDPVLLCRTSSKHAHWTLAQMIAHHTTGGCNLLSGDLIGSGTMSGPGDGELACLLEATVGATLPIELPSGERRMFFEDGDVVTLKGYCEKDGSRRLGFGMCRTTIWPSVAYPRKE